MAGQAIEIEGLAKLEGSRTRLAGIDLSLDPGEHVGVLGRPAAGTSALAAILAGLRVPTAGEIRVDGRSILAEPDLRAHVGVLPARAGLDEQSTPRELLRMAGRLHGLRTSETERRLEQLLMAVELEHLGGHAVEHLETGMRRRLALAYALVPDPPVLGVEEPTRGLGPEETRRLRDAIGNLAEERTLLVLATQPDDIEQLCERVVGLENGAVVLDADLAELAGQRGLAVQVELTGELPQEGLDELRDHAAIGALRRHPEGSADLELWITDPDQSDDVLRRLVEAGASVRSFARVEPDLGDLVGEHMEGPL